MSPNLPNNKDMTASSSESDPWLSEGFADLEQFRRDALLAPSAALTAKISTRVASLQELLIKHQALLNTCTSPLLRMPHEIQQHIFAYVADAERVQKWIRLGQICSTLRNVLLDFHGLWAGAVCSYDTVRARDIVLERAGPSAPLALYVHPGHGAPDACQFAISQLHRARVINTSDPSLVRHIMHNPDVPPMPYLEKVVLIADSGVHSAADQLRRDTPQLKDIRMDGVFWSLSAPNLTALAIFDVALTDSQLLDLLQQSRLLQTLTLGCMPDLSSAAAYNVVITLPFLERLYVGCEQDRALRFWRLLRVPLSAKLEFEFEDEPDVQHIVPTRQLDLGVLKSHFGGRPPLKLVLESTQDEPLCFNIFLDADSTTDNSEPPLRIIRSGGENSDDPLLVWEANVLNKVCNELELYTITCFQHQGSYDNWDSDAEGDDEDIVLTRHTDHWRAMLSRFTQLEQLDIYRIRTPLCIALGSPLPHSSSGFDDVSTAPLLPCLRQLTTRGAEVDFEASDSPYKLSPETFLDLVLFRLAQDLPLDTITFHDLSVVLGTDGYPSFPFLDKLRLQDPNCQVISL